MPKSQLSYNLQAWTKKTARDWTKPPLFLGAWVSLVWDFTFSGTYAARVTHTLFFAKYIKHNQNKS